jgi:N-acetylglucosaminyl-diphospho-decaprenol L-rhamnosyltransferase
MTPAVSASAAPEVAVVVVSWNTRDLLADCLRSLAAEAEAGRAEVWVVDNASTDGSPELVAQSFPWVRLEAREDNLGFGRAVNLVAARTRSPWLAMANADIALRPGALDELLAAGAGDASAGALAPRLVLPDGTTQHSVFPFPTVPFTLLFNSGLPGVVPALADRLCLIGAWDPERARRVPWAVGAFLLVRRSAWDEVGGFDDHQWMYAEDLDLGWRLDRAGRPTRYVPGAVVDHHSAAATTQAWGDDRTARWQRSTYAWMLRRRGPARTRLVAGINVLACLARWAVLTPAALVRPGRWGPPRHAARQWARRHAAGLQPAETLARHR